MGLKIGDKVKGKIVKITNYGAFLDIGNGKWGLIHISKVAKGYVKNVEDHIKKGQEVEATVIGVDKDGKVSLSLVEENKEFKEIQQPPSFKRDENLHGNFEDKLDKFLKDNEDKISQIRNARVRKTRGKR